MKNVFYFNGCSQTAGIEIVPEKPDMDAQITKQLAWPKHLTMNINPDAEYVNDAVGGGSNARIFRTTIEWLSTNHERLADTFVTIMWTEPERFEFVSLDGRMINIIANGVLTGGAEEKYLMKFTNEYLAKNDLNSVNNLNLMFALSSILDSLGVRYIFLNAFRFAHFYTIDQLASNPIRTLSKIPAVDKYLNDEWCFEKLLTQHEHPHTQFLHFNEEAHKFYASKVLEWINNEKIL